VHVTALRAALRLLVITDDLRDGIEGLVSRTAAAVRGGATMVQVRLKDGDARTLTEVTRAIVSAVAVPVVVNDRADVALAAGAQGVHVGPDDVAVDAIRRFAPAGFVIGASLGAGDDPGALGSADYVGIGPVYATASKADAGAAIGVAGFATLRAVARRPVVGIGGITAANAGALQRAGADGIAVIHAVLAQADPEAAARALRAAYDA
jgi:thiamine-phosphate pyrophosphorylase